MNPYPERLQLLRQAMVSHGVDACLIPSSDPHLSEYLPAHWLIRPWLTGFSGSVGTIVVTAEQAGLWVDSRYWVQAQKELEGSGFALERIDSVADPAHVKWLDRYLSRPGVLAVDGRTLSVSAYESLRDALDESISIRLDLDLPGQIWAERPALPDNPVYELEPAVACRSRAEKLDSVRQAMLVRHASHHLVSTLDDIAWILNLRGSDVSYNPVFVAHLLITQNGASLFVEPGKIHADLQASLHQDGVVLVEYGRVTDSLEALEPTDWLMFDPRRTVCALVSVSRAHEVRASNPSTLLKACKSEQELSNWREVMRRDGAALCEFFAWLDDAIRNRHDSPLDECLLDQKLTACRALQPGFVSRSFATIAAFGANAAMPHYRATEQSHAVLEGDGLLLIDSGGQYQGGTTDITRMVPVGDVSEQERLDCTLVLSAMIAMSRLRFPKGIAAPLIDAVARAPLWERLADYGHGTGHGVGYFLNVHEGPQVLSYRAVQHPDMGLLPGMVTSNEPGLYRPGKWGVRIENLTCCRIAGESPFGTFLEFETLTLCPIDTRCLEVTLLRTDEVQWLNEYHRIVREQLAPLLSGPALQWMLDRTMPLSL